MASTDHGAASGSPSASLSPSSSSHTPSRPRSPSRSLDGRSIPHPKVVSFRRDSSIRRESGEMNEQSPLLQPRASRDDEALKVLSPLSDDEWQNANEESKSTWYLILLTLGGLGLQIGWSVETSYGSPYLLSLGLSKSLLAFVWIAGPLSGVLVQPYVGLKSDNCRWKLGKRRPFIIGGAAATIVSLMVLAWAKEIVSGFLRIFGADPESQFVKNSIALFAVLFVYVLDFAINVIQAGLRAYVVDCTPTHQQEAANAWIMRTQGLGNILGYLSGFVNLPKYLSWLGQTQFKILCAIASFTMAVTVTISCSTISERDPSFDGVAESQSGILEFFRGLFRSIRKLPDQIRKVCEVQFFAWIGWFPFLFYITTYIGEIYVEPFFEENPHMTEDEINKLWENGTRYGTFALLIFAITTLVASIILPLMVEPTFKAPATPPRTPMTPTTPRSLDASANGYFPVHKPFKGKTSYTQRFNAFLSLLQIPGFTLRRAWMFSHVMFAVLMWMTIFVRNTFFATCLVALVGFPWALTQWAPFALISSEISKRDAIRRGLVRPTSRDAALLAAGEDDSDGADQAGVVLGIHNVAIAAPQVIATLVSSAIFHALQKPRGTPGDFSVEWVLRFGGVCALAAAFVTRRVHEEGGDVFDEGIGTSRGVRHLD